MSETLPREIRCVVLPVTGGSVLVPSSNMAEVITYAQPAAIAHAPAWLIGRSVWRGWGLPVLAFSVLAGAVDSEPTLKSRVAILKALSGHARLPYFGVLTQGFPRLTLVSAEMLAHEGGHGDLPAGVREQVLVHGEPAWIPDLAVIERATLDALARAA